MTAYFIAIRDKTKDATEMAAYSKAAGGTMAGHKITPRAHYGRHLNLEGAPTEGIVILEFPTVEEAEAWCRSPEYQKAAVHRHKGADYRVFIVEGV